MTEVYMTIQYLGIAIAILVIVQVISMNQIDTLVLLCSLRTFAGRTLTGGLHGKHHTQHHQSDYDKQQSLQLPTMNLINKLPYPAFVFELTITIAFVDTYIGGLNAVDHPLMQAFLTTFLQYQVLHDLEVLRDS